MLTNVLQITNGGRFSENRALDRSKIMGRRLFTRAPHAQTAKQNFTSITTITSGVTGYGPSHTLRACYDLIKEAAVLIFSDDLDAGAAAAHVADRNRSAFR